MKIQMPEKMGEVIFKPSRQTTIYVWICPDTGNPVYVGKTDCPLSIRMASHRRCALKKATTPKHQWLKEVLVAGKELKISILEICERADGGKRESHWIKELGEKFVLLNVATGGQGGKCQVKIRWTDRLIALLGKTTDRQIAIMLGCSRSTVSYRRTVLNIPRFPDPHIVPFEVKLSDEIIKRLGTEPDYTLAEEVGCSKFVIRKARRRMGLPSYAMTSGNNGRIKKGEPHRRWNSA